MIKHSILAAMAAAWALPLAASALLLPNNCPEPFDLNLDGVSDAFQVGADATTAEILSGAQGAALLHALSTGDASREFTGAAAAFSVQTPGVPTVAAGLQVNATFPLGAAVAMDPVTGAIDWMIPGTQGCTVGGAIEAIADQDGDGVCDLLTAADEQAAQSAMLISGGRGTVLAVREGTLTALAAYSTAGGRLYAPEDLDDSGLVDSADIDLFFSYLSGNNPQADINGDGAADGTDFVAMVNAYQQGLTTVMSLGNPPGIAGGGNEPEPNLPMPLPEGCDCPDGAPPAGCTLQMTLECGLGVLVRPGSVAMIRPTFKDAAGAVIDWTQLPQGEWCYEKLSGPEGSIVSGGIITSPVEGGVSARVRFAYRLPNGDLCCLTAECGVTFGYDCLPPCIDLAPCDLTRAVNSAGELWVSACTNGDNGPWDPAGWTYEWTVTAEGGGQSLSVPMIWWEGPYAFFETANETTTTAENVPSSNRVRVHVRVMTECGPVEAECLFDVLGDQDGDGLNDTLEIVGGCPDPTNPDSDGDGFPDGSEKPIERCDPAKFPDIITDSDNDGLPDYYEGQPVAYDPLGAQHPRRPDGSPFPPPRPQAPRGTNRYDFDSDDDGVSDRAEHSLGFDPLDPTSNTAEPGTMDGWTVHAASRHVHGIFDEYLDGRGYSSAFVDHDRDGLPDAWELVVGLDPELPEQGPGAPGNQVDSDGDGLCDSVEARLGTNASSPDTDGDGLLDGDEIAVGLDPRDYDSDDDGVFDGAEDYDNDGIFNGAERGHGTDPARYSSSSGGVCDTSMGPVYYREPACPEYALPPLSCQPTEDCLIEVRAWGSPGSWLTFDNQPMPVATCGVSTLVPFSPGIHSISGVLIADRSQVDCELAWWHAREQGWLNAPAGRWFCSRHIPDGGFALDRDHNQGRLSDWWCIDYPECRFVARRWTDFHRTLGNATARTFQVVVDQDNDDGHGFPTGDPSDFVKVDALPSDQSGKLIWVASGDSDVDGIPDYADGFGVFDQAAYQSFPAPAQTQAIRERLARTDRDDTRAQLVPLTICLPDDLQPTDEIEVSYLLSDPDLLHKTEGELFTLPVTGRMRLWAAPWSNRGSAPVPAGIRDPNNTSVRGTGSTCAYEGTIMLGRSLVRPGTYSMADLLANPGDQITWYVEAVKPSTALQDLQVAISLRRQGQTLATRVASFTAVDQVFLPINPDGTLGNATKAPAASKPVPVVTITATQITNIRPHETDFTKIVADVVVEGTVLDQGCDIVPGARGTIPILGAFVNGDPLAGIDVQVSKGIGPQPNDPARLRHPYRFSGMFARTLTAVEVTPGDNEVLLTAPGPFGSTGTASVRFTITPSFQGASTGVIDWRAFSFATSPVQTSAPGAGGTFNPVLTAIVGPPELARRPGAGGSAVPGLFDEVEIGAQRFALFTLDGHMVLKRLDEDFASASFISLTARSEDLYVRIGDLVFESRDGLDQYALGIARGLADAGMEWANGWGEIGGAVREGVNTVRRDYSVRQMVFRFRANGNVLTEKHAAAVQATCDAVEEFITAAADLLKKTGQEYSQYVAALIRGDHAALEKLSAEARETIQVVAAVYDEIRTHLAMLDDYEKGKIVGRVIGEVLIAVAEALVPGALLNKGRVLQKLAARLDLPSALDAAENAAAASRRVGGLISKEMQAKHPGLVANIKGGCGKVVRNAQGIITSACCFAAGTVVHTTQGAVPIECIEPGDVVLSRAEGDNECCWQVVTRTIRTSPRVFIHIEYAVNDGESQTISATPEHPFFDLLRQRFVLADELAAGDLLALSRPGYARVISARREAVTSHAVFAHNLEVAESHTYFVGADKLWVHNESPKTCDGLRNVFDFIRKSFPNNPMEAFRQTLQSIDDVPPALARGLIEDTRDEIRRLGELGSLSDGWQQFYRDHDGTPQWKDVFGIFRYKKLEPTKSLRRPQPGLDPAQFIGRADFVEEWVENGVLQKRYWDLKGPYIQDAINNAWHHNEGGVFASLLEHINDERNAGGAERLLIDATALDDQQVQQIIDVINGTPWGNTDWYRIMR
ncbi:MAG TPA: polymorphic toxin-type HINT domain-containing protein [Phycisphaerales bacterium]|nr:polymorphic toxin-type HINT domain-containing protein [Phycisphaerales bacterium]